MAQDDYRIQFNTRSEFRRSAGHPPFQTIPAHYYNITDAEAWPVAGLLVLLDGKGQPVRAELHLYEDQPSHVHEAAIRQSRLLLQDRYTGDDPLPLRIMQTYQHRDAMHVRLSTVTDATPQTPPRGTPSRLLVAALGGAVVLFLIWLVAFYQPGGTPGDTVAEAPAGPETPATNAVAALFTNQSAEGETEEVLPPSRNAHPGIGIGVRVQIAPGLRLTLRGEPGPNAGEVRGAMEGGQTALVIGGPAYTRGDQDTIVWWYVQLDDGTEAWAAANTSTRTVLLPVE